MNQRRVRLKIAGRVQGVFFRDSAKNQASKLGIVGWVKNAPDRTVEIIAEGQTEQLKKFIQWCYNGPEHAQVEKVDIQWEKPTGQFNQFEIKY